MPVRLSFVLGCAAALAGGASMGSIWHRQDSPRLIFLDVGQGDCTVILSAGATFLVDAGPKTESFDAGARIVAPKLRDLGVSRIDILFLTHPDSDHIGGLSGLASRIRIQKVAVPAYFRGNPDLAIALADADIREDEVLWLDRPLSGAAEALRFELRLPSRGPFDSENEGSLLLRFEIGASTAVLTGDAGEETEAIAASAADWHADLLKAGHHGSATSTSNSWLEEVQPRTVVISCGAGNRYGHPAPATLERIQRSGAKALRTDLEGDLIFVPTDNGFERIR